ncbi:Polyketide cyclase / dehydrase and lipid transport [Brevibacterium casei]|uniref:Polyketide cyclase / dehydrase and lipid transport n=1 Tax=Brevibacterium casei TaxID=33889 RepID=A0A449CZC3_9MICO|nr:SRPBCC family protein [Brevibacterium casei]VEW10711.1 Polyketide cyclase / dehydrase and lipid transport [Brevibacterium casei]
MTDTKVSASRTIDAAPEDIFDVLNNPERHAQLDGSGMVVSDDTSDRITRTGQKFTMNMQWDQMGGDYKTDNHVIGYEENKLLAWKTAPAGEEPPGWEWVWELAPLGRHSTEVSVTYDWSAVTDKELLKKISFPVVSEQDLESSLGNLAAAVSQD